MDSLFVVNLDSTTIKRKGSVLVPLSEKCAVPLINVTDFDAIGAQLTQALGGRPGHIFIEGGDGTVQGVMTQFMTLTQDIISGSQITLVPGGMTNQVARNIGLKTRDPHRIERLVAGQVQTHHSAALLHVSSGSSSLYGFLFTTGAVPMATEYCKSKIHARGIGGAAAVAATIWSALTARGKARGKIMKPSAVDLTIGQDGSAIERSGDHLGTLVTTLDGIILGIDPFWGDGDGELRVTYVHKGARHMLRHLISHALGRLSDNLNKDGLESWRADRLDYSYDGPCMIDGEPVKLTGGELSITASPRISFVS